MFKKSIALAIMSMFIPRTLNAVPATQGLTLAEIESRANSHTSRGKSGKHTSKRSNAAAQQRAAKKRNNIRKHK
jgi:hypothetical protein